MNRKEAIIKALDLKPHPEGGYFKETYRSKGEITTDSLNPEYSGKRNYSTCIYFMLTSDTFSAFHKIKQDEIWHFYDGATIHLHIISATGEYSEHIIGRNFANGEVPQLIVPGNSWFAARVVNENAYSLVGCTVAPGFDFDDFVMPTRAILIAQFPQHEAIITELTHS
ncbi:cupin domain-containing protein [Flavobacterium litorale]|uniref:Cupin domain-containing protein n=1 Tax=Flavobacterium litorale TaxID=2856519 RepID=A0ABX8VCM9_9FLAO|nr:cupin domain-containing protein [Flavobacterium litorale]QYJ68424.1 cupin domain-containing protein [Flavobacterium litorale]